MKIKTLIATAAVLMAAFLAAPASAVDLGETTVWMKGPNLPGYGKTLKAGDDALKIDSDTIIFDSTVVDEWTMAVMKLPADMFPELEAGKRYVFAVEAQGGPGASTIITVPEADNEKSTDDEKVATGVWQNTPGGWNKIKAEFIFDPEVNDGRIQFFYGQKQYGALYKYRNFEVKLID